MLGTRRPIPIPIAPRRRRRGAGPIEVIVVLAIVALVALFILAALPRQQEAARALGCQANLFQIGQALALYAQAGGTLPQVEVPQGQGPLAAMLGELGVEDFRGLEARKARSPSPRLTTVHAHRIAGFLCPSDPGAMGGRFPAPVSYRANAGDRPDGQTGPFAPGQTVRLADVEAADGLAYTAAFAERLVGNGQQAPSPGNYAVVPGPLADAPCPPAPAGSWRGEAGSSWAGADWPSTLYNHVLTPNAGPSCLADDGRSAVMGASSGHVDRVHVLLLDGGVRAYSPRVDAKVWRTLGNRNDLAASKETKAAP